MSSDLLTWLLNCSCVGFFRRCNKLILKRRDSGILNRRRKHNNLDEILVLLSFMQNAVNMKFLCIGDCLCIFIVREEQGQGCHAQGSLRAYKHQGLRRLLRAK